MGTLEVECTFNGKTSAQKFHVVDCEGPILVGLPACEKLDLVRLNHNVNMVKSVMPERETAVSTNENLTNTNQLMEQYPNQFQGLGKFTGTASIEVDPSVKPVVHAPRKCPIHLRDDLKKELDRMENMGVIKPVSEATDWVSSLVIAKKPDGRLRVCLDPRDLNKAIKRPHHRNITTEEITHQLAGATVFSKLDARSGYWAIQLDEQSSKLTTFNSPFGRYSFCRLPFGIKLAQDLFQRKMDEILAGLEGVINIADDICVFGKNAAEHTERLRDLMKRAEEKGLVFNPDKCAIGLSHVSFFGHVYSASGISPDPAKVDAIQNLERPKNVAELQSFLGMCTYLSPFIPGFSELTHHLRQMLKENAVVEWTPQACKDFKTLKDVISSDAVLAYYDPSKPVTLEVDASGVALGAVLLQDGRPVAFASKALSDTETRYANIEREMLAVVFGCEKFRTYLFGRSFEVISDHKPLEMILQKSISRAPARLQRMLLRIENYTFTLRYRKGNTMHISDALSRLPTERQSPTVPLQLDVCIGLVQFSPSRLDELREETQRDETLHQLSKVITNGWPARRCETHPAVRPFWSIRDALVIDDGVIIKGTAVVIPSRLQPWYIERLHEGHQGRVKMELRARDAVYWPDLKKDVEARVAACLPCQTSRPAANASIIEAEHQHPVPSGPWTDLSTDLFYSNGKNYIIIVDHFSKFPFVYEMTSTTSTEVVKVMAQLFSEQGSPSTVYSDNGPQYSSREFKIFSEKFGFRHITSSPHHPQSNGIAERHVKTVKSLLQKCAGSHIKFQMGLRALRATPIDSLLPAPAELLLGRKIDLLPHQSLENERTTAQRSRLEHRQQMQRETHNARIRHGRPEPVLNPGDAVYVRNRTSNTWERGNIEAEHEAPSSYIVRREPRPASRASSESSVDSIDEAPAPRTVRRTAQDIRPDPSATCTRSGRVSRAPNKLDL